MARLHKENGKYVIDELKLNAVNTAYLDLPNTSLEIEVKLVDNRKITEHQRKLIFSLCGAISQRTKANSEVVRNRLRKLFSVATGYKEESLSDCNMEYANRFTNFIIEYCNMHRIQIDHIVKGG